VRNAAWAVVPLKSPAAAKSRLRGALDAGARQRLMLCMARHVVRTLVRTPGIAGVAVVTASPDIAAQVERDGAIVIRQDRDEGTAPACRIAADVLSGTATSILMISGDIPLIHAADVAELVELAARTPVVAIVPDRAGEGTNALLCAPPAAIAPCFGPDSFRRHVAAAHARGVEVRIVESDALALDIDDIEDLDELRRRLEKDPSLLPAELREAVQRKDRVPAQ
jgi:2-phospho-L-lactate/phosphoenolpyruvate guanylyltransferase